MLVTYAPKYRYARIHKGLILLQIGFFTVKRCLFEVVENGSNMFLRKVEPDWLLVYRADEEQLELFLFSTGIHADLF